MRIGVMLGDVLRSLFTPTATRPYPFVASPTPERLRGKLSYNPETCIGCELCVRDCPANAIEIITIDKKAKRFVMRYRLDQCIYCAQCVESCRPGSLNMQSDQWELAGLGRESFVFTYGRDEDVKEALAGITG